MKKSGIRLPTIKCRVVFRHGAICSPFHLIAAEFATQKAKEIENKYTTETPPKTESDLYMSQALTAIICSVSALESTINECIVFQEDALNKLFIGAKLDAIKSKYKKRIRNIDKINKIREILGRSFVFPKYDIVWYLITNDFIPSDDLTCDVEYLIAIRNALNHFAPEWDDDLKKHLELEKSINNRFTVNPYSSPNGLVFPYQFLSFSCADWSCSTSNKFINLFKAHTRK